MKRRDKGISNAWSFLLGFVILTVVVPGVLIGPARAVRLIGSAVSSTVLQSAYTVDAPDRIEQDLTVVELLSASEMVFNGVHFPVRSRELTDDRTLIELDSAAATPFGRCRRLVVKADDDLLGASLAMWIAGRIGVPVPMHQPVLLRRDGSEAGIHLLKEYVDRSFEQVRNISDRPVPVMRVKEGIDRSIDPWSSSDHWELSSYKDADKQFGSFIDLLNDSLITPAERRSQLELLIDVDAFNVFHAATFMLGATSEARASVAVVLDPRTLRLLPVLMDAPLVPAADGTITGEVDLLEKRMMAISDWRLQRDRIVKEKLAQMHGSGAFDQKLDELSRAMRPSVKNVGSSRRPLFSMQGPAASGAGIEWSVDDIRKRVKAHWDRILPVVSNGTVPTDVVIQ